MSDTWKIINEASGRTKKRDCLPNYFIKKIVTDDGVVDKEIKGDYNIAYELNNYYANIGTVLSEKIKYDGNKTVNSYLINETEKRFKFNIVTDHSVQYTISKLKPKLSSGHDNISSKLLLQMSPTIHSILRSIINQSITTGIVPDQIKIAEVIPIYKGKDSNPNEFGNYRPISLLPAFSKVIEKTVHHQLYRYLHYNHLLNKDQYGFRANHSTEYAAIDLIDRLKDSLSANKTPFTVFLDLSKAFDTLDHRILLKKLKHYGIRDIELKWFENYLGGRQQYVKYNNVTSPYVGIKTGVPQGSVLGPLLFLVYINDLTNATKALGNVLFADDTNLPGELENFFKFIGGRHIKPITATDVAELSNAINAKLALIVEWLKINKLSLNTTKTKYMLFHKTNKDIEIYDTLELIMDNIVIDRTDNFNMLGLTINETLTWTHHTKKVASKIGSAIGAMFRLKNTISKKAILSLYNALVLSHLHYCNLLWGHSPGKLEVLQKKAIRAVTGYRMNAHTKPLCRLINTPLLTDIHEQKLLCLYKKIRQSLIPENIRLIFFNICRTYKNTVDASITRLQSKQLRYELPLYLKNTTYKSSLAYMEGETRNVNFNTTKKEIKENILSTYPTECTVQNCYICNKIKEDESLPKAPSKEDIRRKNKKARERKKKKKSAVPKPPCLTYDGCKDCKLKKIKK
jgi:hypothetical protein